MKYQSKFKTTLSIEESAKLIELGVDPKLASRWIKYGERVFDGNPQPNPVFSLTDLLSILPKEITYLSRRILTIICTDELYFAFYASWEREYEYSTEDTVTHHDGDRIFSEPELIDSLYSLLIWAIEHNFVNTKDEKK